MASFVSDWRHLISALQMFCVLVLCGIRCLLGSYRLQQCAPCGWAAVVKLQLPAGLVGEPQFGDFFFFGLKTFLLICGFFYC